MWLLNFIPNFVIHLAVAAGVAALLATVFLDKFIPALYAMPVKILAIVLLAASLWLEGANYNQQVWMDRVAELEAKVKIAEEKSAQVNTQIEYKFIDKVKVVHDTQVVIQERIREVEKIIDAKCEVPREAIDLLNQAAQTPGVTK
jgi:hypothetical protein